MERHLSLSILDSFLDAVLKDIPYPFEAVNEHKPFDESELLEVVDADDPPATFYLDKKSSLEWLDAIDKNSVDEDELAASVAALQADLEKRAGEINADREAAEKEGLSWDGPGEAELQTLVNKSDWDAAFHCKWIRVVLKTAPSAEVKSPVTLFKGIHVHVSATGEAWVKHWYPKCVRRCPRPFHGLCCRWRSSYKWTRLASITVRNLDLAADARIEFAVENSTAVVGRPLFDKLRIDRPILKEIQLEEVVNWFMRRNDQKVVVLKHGDILFEVELVKGSYTAESLELPASEEGIAIDVKLRRL